MSPFPLIVIGTILAAMSAGSSADTETRSRSEGAPPTRRRKLDDIVPVDEVIDRMTAASLLRIPVPSGTPRVPDSTIAAVRRAVLVTSRAEMSPPGLVTAFFDVWPNRFALPQSECDNLGSVMSYAVIPYRDSLAANFWLGKDPQYVRHQWELIVPRMPPMSEAELRTFEEHPEAMTASRGIDEDSTFDEIWENLQAQYRSLQSINRSGH